jgi:hypothetical protein
MADDPVMPPFFFLNGNGTELSHVFPLHFSFFFSSVMLSEAPTGKSDDRHFEKQMIIMEITNYSPQTVAYKHSALIQQ